MRRRKGRPSRKLHALVEQQRLVMPGRLAIVAIALGARHHRGVLIGRQSGVTAPPSGETKPGEEAVEPRALLGTERRRLAE